MRRPCMRQSGTVLHIAAVSCKGQDPDRLPVANEFLINLRSSESIFLPLPQLLGFPIQLLGLLLLPYLGIRYFVVGVASVLVLQCLFVSEILHHLSRIVHQFFRGR